MSQAKGGFKTKLQRDAAGDGSNWQQVAEIMDITGPGSSQLIEDATNMDSTDGWEEKIAIGLRAASDVTFTMHLLQDDSSQNAMYADLNASTLRNFRILIPPGYTKRVVFSAFVSNIGASYPLRGKMVHDVTLSVTGKPTREAHS